MRFNHNIIGFIIFCIIIASCLHFYTWNGTSIYISSSSCKHLSAIHEIAVFNLKSILSTINNNPKLFKEQIVLKITETVRILQLENKTPSQSDISDLRSDYRPSEYSRTDSLEVNVVSTANILPEQLSNKVIVEPYACPEKFLHAKYGDPYFMSGSWINEDCGEVKSVSSHLSVVYVKTTKDLCSEYENQMLLKIITFDPEIPILTGVPKYSNCSSPEQDIKMISFSPKTKLSVQLNVLISIVETPLILIARNLDDFNWLARLERQLSVFSLEPDVVIVGGSIRNRTGHWQVGCYQTEMKNYILKYTDGYYKSKHECMYCDYLMGPFITRTQFLRDNKFDENLADDVVFEDFFLRIKTHSKGHSLICPDVMYHSTDPGIQRRTSKRETWFPLIVKWQLNRIVLPNGQIYKYSCKESKLSCESLVDAVGSKMMPVCCRDAMINGYKVFHEFCLKHDVVYQIEGGSALGAVKFGDVIPWDFDGDGSYYADKMNLFSKELNWTNANGKVYVDHIKFKAKGFFYVSTPHAFIEFWAVPKLSVDGSNLTEVFRNIPTLVRIGDVWVYAPPSPGLYARNYYGREMLRHSNSYYHLDKDDWYSPYNVSDPFISCDNDTHHACLDKFDKDGNMQFKIP